MKEVTSPQLAVLIDESVSIVAATLIPQQFLADL